MAKVERKNAKPLIMDTALAVFAEKGYDGARMDEIASRAGVPKSLIYYHFKSKSELLEELTKSFYERYGQLLGEALGDDEKIEMSFRIFVNENEQMIRLVLLESLKGENRATDLFQFVEGLMQHETEVLGRDSANKSHRMLAEFFLNILPRALFVCYREDWARHFGIEPETVNKDFYDVMVEMHQSYLAKLF